MASDWLKNRQKQLKARQNRQNQVYLAFPSQKQVRRDGGGQSQVLYFEARLSSVRRLVNVLPVAQRINAFTNGVVGRPWVVGSESHVHRENAF